MHTSPSLRLVDFLDGIERWRDEPDIPPFIEVLISTPVRDLQSTQQPARVKMSSSILETIESFKESQNVVVNKSPDQTAISDESDVIFSRMAFLEHALQVPNLMAELSTSGLAERVPSLGWVDGDDTIDIALQRMIATGFDQVGVMNSGMTAGVLHVDDVFTFLLREVTVSTEYEGKLIRMGTNSTFRITGENTENGLQPKCEDDKKEISQLQLSAMEWSDSGWTECLLMCCIFLDVICLIVEWESRQHDTIDEQKLMVATGIILLVFVYEASVRWIGRRNSLFLQSFELLDICIVVASAIVYVVVLASDLTSNSNPKVVVTIMRVLRLLRQIKIVRYMYKVYRKRHMRYCRDGFNLDLSYITNTCIAMSQPVMVPSPNFVNPIKELRRFFSTKYPGRYLIFNLCSESTYKDEYFGGRVENVSIAHHNPPKMHQMVGFVERAGRFLDENQAACIAVHCSDGLGRTSVMVAAWLLYTTFADSVEDAMKWFAASRIGSGEEPIENFVMASQRRYVQYMHQALSDGGYLTRRLTLTRIVLHTCPKMDTKGGCNLWFTIEERDKEIFCSSTDGDSIIRMTKSQEIIQFDLDLVVSSDVRIVFYHQDVVRGREQLCFFLCFHTGFVDSKSCRFDKHNIDMASNDSSCKVFDKNFSLVLGFQENLRSEAGLTPTSSRRASSSGAFRKIVRPSASITESAALMRCRDSSVQAKIATRLQTKVRLEQDISTSAISGPADEGDLGTLENLCPASGEEVKHIAVDMFKVDVSEVFTPFNSGRTKPSSSDAFKPLKQSVQGLARSLVSGNKRRFLAESFDLDLTYVTPRIIAMGFPSRGLESNYRNSADDVYRFFQQRHAAHYLIVNLCSEREYDLDTFHGNCVRYPFDDHTPPALELMIPCCACIHKFLQADENNVVAIHCKAGKGRTGLIIVAYLMYCGFKSTCISARHFYDWARTKDGKGLTIISQIRYSHYFEQQLRLLKQGKEPLAVAQDKAPALRLLRFRLHTIPRIDSSAFSPSVSVSVRSEIDHRSYQIFKSNSAQQQTASSEGFILDQVKGCCDLNLNGTDGVRVAGDFQVIFFHQSKTKIFSFWLHSALVVCPPSEMGGVARHLSERECLSEGLPSNTTSLMLLKREIDTAAKDKRCNRFKDNFKVEMFVSCLPGQAGSGPALEAARTQGKDGSFLKGEDFPLYQDRERYKRIIQHFLTLGRPIPSFEDWLFGRVEELERISMDAGSGRLLDQKWTSSRKQSRESVVSDDRLKSGTPTLGRSFIEADIGFATPDSTSTGLEFVALGLRPSAAGEAPARAASPHKNGDANDSLEVQAPLPSRGEAFEAPSRPVSSSLGDGCSPLAVAVNGPQSPSPSSAGNSWPPATTTPSRIWASGTPPAGDTSQGVRAQPSRARLVPADQGQGWPTVARAFPLPPLQPSTVLTLM